MTHTRRWLFLGLILIGSHLSTGCYLGYTNRPVLFPGLAFSPAYVKAGAAAGCGPTCYREFGGGGSLLGGPLLAYGYAGAPAASGPLLGGYGYAGAPVVSGPVCDGPISNSFPVGMSGGGYDLPAYGGGYSGPIYSGGYSGPVYSGGYSTPISGAAYSGPVYGSGGFSAPSPSTGCAGCGASAGQGGIPIAGSVGGPPIAISPRPVGGPIQGVPFDSGAIPTVTPPVGSVPLQMPSEMKESKKIVAAGK